MGFGANEKDLSKVERAYEAYLGRNVTIEGPNFVVIGTLKDYNLSEGYVELNPSLVRMGNKLRVEDDSKSPTVFSFPPGMPAALRPLRKGDLEDIAQQANGANDEKKDLDSQD